MTLLYSYRLTKETREGAGFTSIDNRIAKGEISELSAEARYVLWQLLTYNDGWDMNWDNFQQSAGITENCRENAIKELRKKGHFETVKIGRNGTIWLYKYTVYELPKWFKNSKSKTWYVTDDSSAGEDFGGSKVRRVESSEGSFSGGQLSGGPQITPYNKEQHDKHEIKKEESLNKDFAETSFRMKNSSDNSFNDNHDNHDTCEHVTCISTDTSTISEKNLTKHDNMKIGGLTKLNNSENTYEQKNTANHKPKRVSQNCVKGVDSSGKKTRNMMEVHEAQPKMSVKDIMPEQEGIKGSEQTEEEKLMARIQDRENEALARIQEATDKLVKERVSKNIRDNVAEKICKQIDMEFKNPEVRALFKDYVNHIATVKKLVSQQKYDIWKKQLMEGATDEIKIQMLQKSITHDYPDLYVPNDKKDFKKSGNKTTTNPIKDKKVEPVADKTKSLSKEQTTLATDENGNPLLF